MSKKTPVEYPRALRVRDFISGQSARRYRKKLAKVSDRVKDTILTTKFRLELPTSSLGQLPFDYFRELYKTVEGIEKGSLSHLLFSTVLSGFRLFGNASEAATFAAQNVFDDKNFADEFERQTGFRWPDFVPTKIVNRLSKEVRATKGKDNRFVTDVIVGEYQKTFAIKELNDEQKEKTSGILKAIGDGLVGEFTGEAGQKYLDRKGKTEPWALLKKNQLVACKVVDKALAGYGLSLPSIANMQEQAEVNLPKGSSIAFDVNSTHYSNSQNNLAPYLVVAIIASRITDKNSSKNDLRKFVQQNLTTQTNNALSWLFGTGLAHLKNADADTLMKEYGVPENRRKSVEQLRNAGCDVIEQGLILGAKGPESYAIFRSSVGGHLDSWVANYVNRLFELRDLVASLPDVLTIPSEFINGGKDFLDETNCKREEINALIEQFDKLKEIQDSLDRLLGRKPDVTENDIVAVRTGTALINRLVAIREQLSNSIYQASQDEGSHWVNLGSQLGEDWVVWGRLIAFPKLNDLAGGVPEVESDLAETKSLFDEVLRSQYKHYSAIEAYAEKQGKPLNPFERLEGLEQDALQKRPNERMNAPEQALRRVLQRVGNVIRQKNDAYAAEVRNWYLDNPLFDDGKGNRSVFASRKLGNQYFFNKQGRIYVSPFSPGRHDGYALNERALKDPAKTVDSLGELLGRKRDIWAMDANSQDTWLRVNRVWLAYRMSGLVEKVPKKIAELILPMQEKDAIPQDINMLLSADAVEPSAVQRAFNLYSSLLSGYQTVLNRERFYLRSKFAWVGNNELLYVLKDKSWTLPERYFNSKSWKELIENETIEFSEGRAVNVEATFHKATALITENPVVAGRILKQLPHDWCWKLPFEVPIGDSRLALSVQKKGKNGNEIKPIVVDSGYCARLVGPSSMKGALDDLLDGSGKKTVGDMNLLVDQPIRKASINGGAFKLDYEDCQFSLAIPFSEKMEKAESAEFPFKRVVGIDQGEAGLAYAVFDLKDVGNIELNHAEGAKPIACGTVRIPSIKRLIKGVRRYRKGHQQMQKFNQKFDSTMFALRENVAGDVCGVIEGLMERYNAFPVLESQVRNLESGYKQLELVYKEVNVHFLYNNIDMQEAKRKSWWYSDGKWVSNLLRRQREIVSDREDSGGQFSGAGNKTIKINGVNYREQNLFPGAQVSAANTSRICACCGRNVYELLPKNDNARINVSDDGTVELGGERIKLYRRPSREENKIAARQNQRADWKNPIASKSYTVRELRSIIRANLRRQPKSLQSKDTTQSVYYCVFADCKQHNQPYHADVNAAINIGRRFLSETIKKKN